MAHIMQRTYNPADFRFKWTSDGWYDWDRKGAHKDALQSRNAQARKLRKDGYRVKCFSMSGKRRRGGIGSGRPDIELLATVYGFNVYSD